MVYECDNCSVPLPLGVTACPKCGEQFEDPVPADAEVPAKGFTAKAASDSNVQTPQSPMQSDRQGLETKQVVGVIGAIILFIGAFTPIVSLPVVGSVNYFQNGKGDGTILIGLAIVSILLALTKRYVRLWDTGALSLGLLAFTYFQLQARIAGMQESMAASLADNPFKGLGDLMVQSVQIQWGWALLVVGALLLIGAAALRSESSAQENKSAPAVACILFVLIAGGSYAYAQQQKAQVVDAAKAKAADEQRQKDAEAAQQQKEQDAQAAEEQAKQNAVNQLTLKKWGWQNDDYSHWLEGTVVNDSDRTLSFVTINFDLLDSDGNSVGTADDIIETLGPGETWKFKAIVFKEGALHARVTSLTGRAE